MEFTRMYIFDNSRCKYYEVGTLSKLVDDFKESKEEFKAIGIEYIDEENMPCAVDLYNNKGICEDYKKYESLKKERTKLDSLVGIIDKLVRFN